MLNTLYRTVKFLNHFIIDYLYSLHSTAMVTVSMLLGPMP